jgi:hypothetical protein
MHILAQHNPWKLPDTVDAEDREDVIVAAIKRGHHMVIVGYRRVSEGLNLQIIDTLIWFEMAQHLILLTRPASAHGAWANRRKSGSFTWPMPARSASRPLR